MLGTLVLVIKIGIVIFAAYLSHVITKKINKSRHYYRGGFMLCAIWGIVVALVVQESGTRSMIISEIEGEPCTAPMKQTVYVPAKLASSSDESISIMADRMIEMNIEQNKEAKQQFETLPNR